MNIVQPQISRAGKKNKHVSDSLVLIRPCHFYFRDPEKFFDRKILECHYNVKNAIIMAFLENPCCTSPTKTKHMADIVSAWGTRICIPLVCQVSRTAVNSTCSVKKTSPKHPAHLSLGPFFWNLCKKSCRQDFARSSGDVQHASVQNSQTSYHSTILPQKCNKVTPAFSYL